LDFLAIHAQAKPDALAQVEGDRRLTWRELLERRNRLANSLVKQGVGRGEHVIIYAPNSLEYLLASAATRAANAVCGLEAFRVWGTLALIFTPAGKSSCR